MTNLLFDLKQALANERKWTVEFLQILGEVDDQKLYAEPGYSCLYDYCRFELGLSDDQAYRRIKVARVARRYPWILPLLENGRLHLTGVSLLAKHLDDNNVAGLVKQAEGKTKVEIEELIATWFPKETSRTRDQVSPVSAHEYEVRFVVDAETKELLEHAKALMPGASLGAINKAALEVLIAKIEKQKFKTTDRPRSELPEDMPAGEAYIPAAVKRAVFKRDHGRCTYVSAEGRRCGSCTNLEFDHRVPTARGGKSTDDNVRLRCHAHNQLAADQIFGRRFMDRKRGRATLTGQAGAVGRAAM